MFQSLSAVVLGSCWVVLALCASNDHIQVDPSKGILPYHYTTSKLTTLHERRSEYVATISARSLSSSTSAVAATTTVGDARDRMLNFADMLPPDCVDEVEVACPKVYAASKSDFYISGFYTHESEAHNRTCDIFTSTSCPGVCEKDSQPVQWLMWVMDACDQRSMRDALHYSDFSKVWIDHQNATTRARDALIPWSWTLTYNASLDHSRDSQGKANGTAPRCASVTSKIVSFAVVNAVVFFVDVIVVRRDVMNFLTRGKLGKNKPIDRLWFVMGLLSVGVNVGANFINAAITKAKPGFGGVSLVDLTLLWSSRPRLAWIVLAFSATEWQERIYVSAALSALLAEFILQGIGSVYLGKTVHRGVVRNYYGSAMLWKYIPDGTNARVMYTGALLWVVFTGFAFFFAIYTLSLMLFSRHADAMCYETDPKGSPVLKKLMLTLAFLMTAPYLGQWMFWVGYIKLAGDTYCPPKVWTITGVWATLASVGVMLGSAS